jgi:hypothetical protein
MAVGRALAAALLFYGCRSLANDLYAESLTRSPLTKTTLLKAGHSSPKLALFAAPNRTSKFVCMCGQQWSNIGSNGVQIGIDLVVFSGS